MEAFFSLELDALFDVPDSSSQKANIMPLPFPLPQLLN